MAITTITGLVNTSSAWVRLEDHRDGGALTVAPGETGALHLLVPWCNNQDDFEGGHFLLLSGPGFAPRLYWLWQDSDDDGDFVRFATDGRYHGRGDRAEEVPGRLVPGDANPGAIAA